MGLRSFLTRRIALATFAACYLVAGGIGLAGEVEDKGFGEAVEGLVMRVKAAVAPERGNDLFTLVEVEMRATDPKVKTTVDGKGSHLSVHGPKGAKLPAGVQVFPVRTGRERAPVEVNSTSPGTWTFPLLRVTDDAPAKVRVASTWTSTAADTPRAPLRAPDVEIDLSRAPVARSLAKDHVGTDWSSAHHLVYRLHEGLAGWRVLEITPDGRAHVFRSEGHGDRSPVDREAETKLPEGAHTAQLTAKELTALAQTCAKHRIWTLDDLPKRMLIPDEASATFAIVAGKGAMIARYPLEEAQKHAHEYPALEKHLHVLMRRVALRAKKGKR